MSQLLTPKKPKYAFTANAFVRALEFWGQDLFTLPTKIIVCEHSLLTHPAIKDVSSSISHVAALVHKHWYDIESPLTYGLSESDNEWQALERLANQHPDNVYLCIDTINELAYFSRVYASDELLNIAELGDHFQK